MSPEPGWSQRARAALGHRITQVPGIRTVWPRLGGTVAASLGVQLTLVVTGIMLARALGPADRGNFAFYTIAVLTALQLGPVGLPYGLSFFITRTPELASQIVAAARRRYIVLSAAATCIAAAILLPLTLDRPDYVLAALPIFVLSIPFSIAHQAGLAVLQGLQEFRPFNVLFVAPGLLFAVLGLALIAVGLGTFLGLASAWLISRLIVAPISLDLAARHARLRSATASDQGPPETETIARFGRRSLIGGASPVEAYRVDQAVIAVFLPPASLGYYVTATAFTNLIRFLGQSVGLVAAPHVAGRAGRSAARRDMWRFLGISAVIALPPAAALWWLGPGLVTLFFGDSFAPAEPLIQPLVAAAYLYALRRALADAGRGAGYPLIGSVAELSSLGFALVGFAILIPTHGVQGAATALMLASGLSLLLLCGLLLRPGWLDQTVSSRDWVPGPPQG